MFGNDLFSSVFGGNLLNNPLTNLSDAHSRAMNVLGFERNLPVRDVFTEFSRAADKLFERATRCFFEETGMYRQRYHHGHLNYDADHSNHAHDLTSNFGRMNLNPVENIMESRVHGHAVNEPVQFVRTRLQWYDSNARRSLVPMPPSPRHPSTGTLTMAEVNQLPISIYRLSITNGGSTPSSQSFVGVPVERPGNNESNSLVPVSGASPNTFQEASNTSFSSSGSPPENPAVTNTESSASTAFLQPLRRVNTLVKIQPLQSSPSRGHPECEVCLTEYHNGDRLRHLPCGHAFHVKCIDVWLKQSTTCPKCRAGIRTGLRRLERSRVRHLGTTQPFRSRPLAGSEPPVRAIRQRTVANTAEPVPEPQAVHSGSSDSSSLSSRSNANQPVGRLHTRLTINRRWPTCGQRMLGATLHTNAAGCSMTTRCRLGGERHVSTAAAGQPNNRLVPAPTAVSAVGDVAHAPPRAVTGHIPVAIQSVNQSQDARQRAVEAAMRRAADAERLRRQESVEAAGHTVE